MVRSQKRASRRAPSDAMCRRDPPPRAIVPAHCHPVVGGGRAWTESTSSTPAAGSRPPSGQRGSDGAHVRRVAAGPPAPPCRAEVEDVSHTKQEPCDPQQQKPKDHRRPVMTPFHAKRDHAKEHRHQREPKLKLVAEPRPKPEGGEDRWGRGTHGAVHRAQTARHGANLIGDLRRVSALIGGCERGSRHRTDGTLRLPRT
jgi:hypothetical protein